MKHILIFFTDQLRFDAVGAYGNPEVQTPALDALADDSIVFEHCITPSPVCVPARLSLFSGQYPARTGCSSNSLQTAYHGDGFYAEITKQGYQSCCVGKMHHTLDLYGRMGFEKRLSQEGTPNPKDDYAVYIREKYPYIFDYHGMRSEMYYVPQISPLPPYDHPSQWVGDRTIDYIRECDPEKPMLLMSSFYHPHPPYSPPAPWNKLYREDPSAPYMPDLKDLEDCWELITDRHSCRRLMLSGQDVLRMKNFYYACVSFVDYQVGRVIDALKEKGMYDDTLILFTSDHGDMQGDFGAFGKRTMMDPACHVPFILHVPGHGHEVRSDVCSLVDVAPTLLSYAGIPYDPGEYDGIDLLREKRREYVFSQYESGKNGVYMVTDGAAKLAYNAQSGRYFFFDGIPEKRNTYSAEDPRIRKMKELLDDYRLSDTAVPDESRSLEPKPRKRHPHYTVRFDQVLYHDEEAAAIPEGYHIDL